MSHTGVLLTAFGGPTCLDEVGPFMERFIGRAVPPAAVERAKERYEAIGGCSPLPAIAEMIAEGVSDALAERGAACDVRVGMRYADPSIEESTLGLVEDGVTRLVHASLSPFESAVSTLAYRDAVCGAAGCVVGLQVFEAPQYHVHPAFVAILAQGAADALASLGDSRPTFLAFTAHSLPLSDIEENDAYVVQLRETAAAVAAELGLAVPGTVRFAAEECFGTLEGETPWILGYQSKGRREVLWLGPDLADVLTVARGEGFASVAVSPIGFVTDHLETLYDLDLEAAKHADSLGLEFARAAVPNDDPAMIEVLVDSILEAGA